MYAGQDDCQPRVSVVDYYFLCVFGVCGGNCVGKFINLPWDYDMSIWFYQGPSACQVRGSPVVTMMVHLEVCWGLRSGHI